MTAQERFDKCILIKNDLAFVLILKEDVLSAGAKNGIVVQLTKSTNAVTTGTKDDLNAKIHAAIIAILDEVHGTLEEQFDTVMENREEA